MRIRELASLDEDERRKVIAAAKRAAREPRSGAWPAWRTATYPSGHWGSVQPARAARTGRPSPDGYGRGLRYIDILAQDGEQMIAYEVKSGGAGRGAEQLAKDRLIGSEGGVLIGKNAPAGLRGTRQVIQTVEIRVK